MAGESVRATAAAGAALVLLAAIVAAVAVYAALRTVAGLEERVRADEEAAKTMLVAWRDGVFVARRSGYVVAIGDGWVEVRSVRPGDTVDPPSGAQILAVHGLAAAVPETPTNIDTSLLTAASNLLCTYLDPKLYDLTGIEYRGYLPHGEANFTVARNRALASAVMSAWGLQLPTIGTWCLRAHPYVITTLPPHAATIIVYINGDGLHVFVNTSTTYYTAFIPANVTVERLRMRWSVQATNLQVGPVTVNITWRHSSSCEGYYSLPLGSEDFAMNVNVAIDAKAVFTATIDWSYWPYYSSISVYASYTDAEAVFFGGRQFYFGYPYPIGSIYVTGDRDTVAARYSLGSNMVKGPGWDTPVLTTSIEVFHNACSG